MKKEVLQTLVLSIFLASIGISATAKNLPEVEVDSRPGLVADQSSMEAWIAQMEEEMQVLSTDSTSSTAIDVVAK